MAQSIPPIFTRYEPNSIGYLLVRGVGVPMAWSAKCRPHRRHPPSWRLQLPLPARNTPRGPHQPSPLEEQCADLTGRSECLVLRHAWVSDVWHALLCFLCSYLALKQSTINGTIRIAVFNFRTPPPKKKTSKKQERGQLILRPGQHRSAQADSLRFYQATACGCSGTSGCADRRGVAATRN